MSLPRPSNARIQRHLQRLQQSLPAALAKRFVEIDLMPVKFRAIDTDEFRLAANRHPTPAAHSGAIYHDGVQAYKRLDAVWPRKF